MDIDAERTPHEQQSSDRINARTLDAMPAARRFLESECTHGGTLTLRCQHDELFQWDGVAYHKLADSELQCMLWEHLDGYASHITNACVANVESAVKSLASVPGVHRMPTWLDGPGEFP